MEIGLLFILMGAIVISFCTVSIVGVISGKIEGIVAFQEKLGVSIFLLICLIVGYALLHGGIKLINM